MIFFNRPISRHKTRRRLASYCKLKLIMSRVVENNAAPLSVYGEPKKKQFTVPYSQGNELVFGQYERQQCLAMSLCFGLQPRTRNQFFQLEISCTVVKFVKKLILFNAD